mmetsp:Transcript_16080/g.18207  ORF Transcript_16080/g.18207 Transcript_16080/m.18207 type:complete len:283 (+) Transcript_16080:126-974(+)
MSTSSGSFTYKNRKVETTEWEDILLEKGIISERPEKVAEKLVDEAIKKQSEVENAKSSEDRAMEKLGDAKEQTEDFDAYLENLDEEDLDVDRIFLEKFRQQRIAELKSKKSKERFGSAIPIQREEFIREVTNASKGNTFDSEEKDSKGDGQWVVVELFKDGIQESSRMTQLINELAKRQSATKFVRIRSTECVENWPDSNVPCLFLYNHGSLQHQVIGLNEFGGGDQSSVEKLEWVLGITYKLFTPSFAEDPFQEKFTMRRDFIHRKADDHPDDSDSDGDWD